MKFAEMIAVMPSTLKGQRKKIFDNVMLEHENGLAIENPEAVYKEIKNRFLEFTESQMERQARYRSNYDSAMKGKLSALQWEPVFERVLTDMKASGLAKNEREAFLDYVAKCGPEFSARILNDFRPRLDRTKGEDLEGGT